MPQTTQGLPHAVAVPIFEVMACKDALQVLGRLRTALALTRSVPCDGGYTGEPFAQGVHKILGEHATVKIAERSELHTFKVIPPR